MILAVRQTNGNMIAVDSEWTAKEMKNFIEKNDILNVVHVKESSKCDRLVLYPKKQGEGEAEYEYIYFDYKHNQPNSKCEKIERNRETHTNATFWGTTLQVNHDIVLFRRHWWS